MYIFASIVASVTALIAAGVLYQRIGARRDRRRYTDSGRWIDIGHDAGSICSKKGRVARRCSLNLEIAATNLNWCRIQETVAQFTHHRVVRPGRSWLEQPR